MYEQEKLEDDRLALRMQKEQLGREKDRLTDEKSRLFDAAVGKPPSEKETLAREIESIDLELEQTEVRFRQVTDELALLRIVDVLRRWPIPGEEHSEREIEAEIRSVARDLDRDAREIEPILEYLGVPEEVLVDFSEEYGEERERERAATDGGDTESTGEQPQD